MTEPSSSAKRQDITELLAQLREMSLSYVRSRTLDPLKGLGRWVAFGLAGTILLCTGTVLLLLGALRALQTETGATFTGHLSWLPYLITGGGGLVVIGAAAAKLFGGGERDR